MLHQPISESIINHLSTGHLFFGEFSQQSQAEILSAKKFFRRNIPALECKAILFTFLKNVKTPKQNKSWNTKHSDPAKDKERERNYQKTP